MGSPSCLGIMPGQPFSQIGGNCISASVFPPETHVACASTTDSGQLTQQTGPSCQLNSSSYSSENYSGSTYSVQGLGLKKLIMQALYLGRCYIKTFARCLVYSKPSRNGNSYLCYLIVPQRN